MFSAHRPKSRTRLRGIATTSAGGAAAAAPSTTALGSFTRRRTAGAATPTATRAQAPALMALRTLKTLASIRIAAGDPPLDSHVSGRTVLTSACDPADI